MSWSIFERLIEVQSLCFKSKENVAIHDLPIHLKTNEPANIVENLTPEKNVS